MAPCRIQRLRICASDGERGERPRLLPTLREIDDESLSALERVLDEATHKRAVVIAVLPNHRTHGSVVELANALLSRERWTVCRRDYPRAISGCGAIEITWSSTASFKATVMGFAPFGEMPVTRRAPYTALALSAGGKNNPYFDLGAPGKVNMAHARHLLSKRKHTTTWAETTSEIRSLLTDPPEDSVSLREISFCLPDVALSRLQA